MDILMIESMTVAWKVARVQGGRKWPDFAVEKGLCDSIMKLV